MKNIVLASNSRYRGELLRKLGLEFISHGGEVDETAKAGETAPQLATRLAIDKAASVAKLFPEHLIIGSDQVAVCDDFMLGKPGDRDNAIRQLTAQSGKIVRFYTSVCVFDATSGRYSTDLDVCEVHFRTLDAEQIHRYIDIDQPFDCAGSFKSEGLGIVLLNKIVGDDPNALIGLPLIKLTDLLAQFGLAMPVRNFFSGANNSNT